MRWEAWEDDGLTFTTSASAADMREQGLIAPDARLLYAFDAESYDAAMTEHHHRQGWTPYTPPATGEAPDA